MNKNSPTFNKLRMIFADILRGYSVCEYKDSEFYIKHLSHYDATDLDYEREKQIRKAAEAGLETETSKLKELEEADLWSRKQESQGTELESYLINLKTTRSKLFLAEERNRITLQIEGVEKEISDLETERKNLLGLTQESFADKKINELYIFSSIFKEQERKTPLFEKEEEEEMDLQELYELIRAYNGKLADFNGENLKRMALSGFFLNLFYLCKDNPFTFYGKPAMDLTFYQAELFTHGRYFKNILQNSKTKPPEDIMGDPDKIIEWYESSTNAQEAMSKINKDSAGGSSIVGASREEMKKLGAIDDTEQGIDLAAEAAKKGGELTMDDLIKLHGH
jgi:hypothetical protein